MSESPKHVSIILCHYSKIDDFNEEAAGKNPPKRSDLLKKCLDSLLTNTKDYPAEIIVMDNGGSPDDSEYLLGKARDGLITHVRFPHNMHFALAWNQGAKLATGQFLSFVCNDIEFQEGWLSACVKILEDYPGKDWLSCPFITYDKQRYTVETTTEGYRVNLRSGSNCMVIRRETFNRIGDFPVHRIGGTVWYNKLYRMGIRTVAPPVDLASDMGWRKGVNFSIPIEVTKTLTDGSVVHFEEEKQ